MTLTLGRIEYCERSFHSTQERAFRVNNLLKLLDFFQSKFLNDKLSIKKITNKS